MCTRRGCSGDRRLRRRRWWPLARTRSRTRWRFGSCWRCPRSHRRRRACTFPWSSRKTSDGGLHRRSRNLRAACKRPRWCLPFHRSRSPRFHRSRLQRFRLCSCLRYRRPRRRHFRRRWLHPKLLPRRRRCSCSRCHRRRPAPSARLRRSKLRLVVPNPCSKLTPPRERWLPCAAARIQLRFQGNMRRTSWLLALASIACSSSSSNDTPSGSDAGADSASGGTAGFAGTGGGTGGVAGVAGEISAGGVSNAAGVAGSGAMGGGASLDCAPDVPGGTCPAFDLITCSCLGCHGECSSSGTVVSDCVCPSCASDSFCKNNCVNDGKCNPLSEGCVCADCASHPQCVGG